MREDSELLDSLRSGDPQNPTRARTRCIPQINAGKTSVVRNPVIVAGSHGQVEMPVSAARSAERLVIWALSLSASTSVS